MTARLLALLVLSGCRPAITPVVPAQKVIADPPKVEAPASVTLTGAPRVGVPDGVSSFRSTIRCDRDADCAIGALPSCGPCGSCPRLIDAREQPSLPQCPPTSPRRAGPSLQPVQCSPCPSAPSYAVCVEGFCAGGTEPRDLSVPHECETDTDCVAAWVGGCCSCPNVVVPLSKAALAHVTASCEAAPCSATRAKTNAGYGPSCDTPRSVDEERITATCQRGIAGKKVCVLRSADGGAP